MTIGYVELHTTSNFSFLEGASHPEELVERAAELGCKALGLADCNSLAGVVRAHMAARDAGLRLLVGARIDLTDAPSLLVYPQTRNAYGQLSQMITTGRRRAEKGTCRLAFDDLSEIAEETLVIVLPEPELDKRFHSQLKHLAECFPDRCYLAAHYRYRGNDAQRLKELANLSTDLGVPLIAANDVCYHAPQRRPLMDVLTCIREHCTIETAGARLALNAERHLKPAGEMARLFQAYPEAVAATVAFAERCTFSLDELRYEYADDPVPSGMTADGYLAQLTATGAAKRYPSGVSAKVSKILAHELELIGQLGYAAYFLTVHDIVVFARSRNILCQGRGSAANSAVCYCLGITAVDPDHLDLLFERFISAERDEPPDIDVDFEHERREEVIQYIYQKYGRERAGLAATIISYRARSAVRDVGKAMGLSEDLVGVLARQTWGSSRKQGPNPETLRELGLDPDDPRLAQTIALTTELLGFPRHLSQHVGGFVIAAERLDQLVPIENAAMVDRTVIQWDKDDLDAMGMLKIDVLALGMLTCIRKAFDLLALHYDRELELATIPPDDTAVYDMLCQGDSLGVFQVESRAQMAFLPRMKPRSFYDLVIEVAIVRPGPIQGDMVHPYLRRRDGLEPVSYPSPDLEAVLGKTLGVPLFQEQAMKIAIVAAGFTPGEADGLRRAMATFRRSGTIHTFRTKMIDGMIERGYEREFAERCFRQIEGFGEYGFPESHAASFALLVYVSAWLKCHYPDVFACALLNSQPMGFYAPAQIVRDASEHNVAINPPDINFSQWDNCLESVDEGRAYALRLGLRQIKGLNEADAKRIVTTRATLATRQYPNIAAMWLAAGVSRRVCERLARADAFQSLGLDRRGAVWAVKGLGYGATDNDGKVKPLPLFAAAEARQNTGKQAGKQDGDKRPTTLPHEDQGEAVANDYGAIALSLKDHPLHLLRPLFGQNRLLRSKDLLDAQPGRTISVAGLILVRQRPGTAKGVIFMTLEDETGTANIIVWPDVFDRLRRVILGARLVLVRGRLQRQGIVAHVIAEAIEDCSFMLDQLALGDRLDPDLTGHVAAANTHGLAGKRKKRLRVPSRDFH